MGPPLNDPRGELDDIIRLELGILSNLVSFKKLIELSNGIQSSSNHHTRLSLSSKFNFFILLKVLIYP